MAITGYRRRAKTEKYETAVDFKLKPAAGEAEMWEALKPLRAKGFKFRRQAVIFGWTVDFRCPSRRLVIEIDGGYHRSREQASKDAWRDSMLSRKPGVLTVRYSSERAATDLEGVIAEIEATAGPRKKYTSWNEGLAEPKPSRSQGRERPGVH